MPENETAVAAADTTCGFYWRSLQVGLGPAGLLVCEIYRMDAPPVIKPTVSKHWTKVPTLLLTKKSRTFPGPP